MGLRIFLRDWNDFAAETLESSSDTLAELNLDLEYFCPKRREKRNLYLEIFCPKRQKGEKELDLK